MHGFLQQPAHDPKTLEMRVELFANQRLLDTYKQRGRVAKRKRDEEPKEYPLAGEDWSSQDESEESQDETEAKEINIKLTGKPQKKKKGSAVEEQDGP